MFTLTIEDRHGGIADEYSFEEGEFLVGRSHSADIILPSDNVSRRHARLYTVENRCYIEDLGSANGVFVNGRRIHEVFEIELSAQIRVGDYYLHVKNDDNAGAAEEEIHGKLIGQNLSVTDEVFTITRTVNLVGRGRDCTVTVIDPSVSRIHAKITVERAGGLTLEDLKSSNGTFVNNERIDTQLLNHEDRVRFGNVEFLLKFPSSSLSDEDRQEDLEDEELDDLPRRTVPRTMWKAIFGTFAGTAALGLILWATLSSEPKTPPSKARTAKTTKAKAQVDAGQDELSKEEEIKLLAAEGRSQIKNRLWERAQTTWRKILKRDPLHTEARRAANQVEIWRTHQKALEQAREHEKNKDYGKAARLLRDIDNTSVYFLEAKQELKRLLETKTVLIMNADALVKQRDCEGALKLYDQAKQLDPRDSALLVKMHLAKAKARNKCR
jgi:pSer/pThr/pTyr-binding forkhead associated (FHA) protein